MIHKDPYGVVLVFGAWNYNLLLSLQPIVGAIAAGNCVVVKPGSFAINSSNIIVRLVNKYMDNRCIFALEGDRHTTAALLKERFDKIFFTGSQHVGRIVAAEAAKFITPVVLELGGKSPCIVDETVDIKIAARRCAWGAFLNGGQTCVRPDYLMVHESIAEAFIEEFKQTVKIFFGEDPKQSDYFGRLINSNAFERLKDCIEADSKYMIHGGTSDAKERYIEPTLFDFGRDLEAFASSQIMSEEIFGPLTPIFRYNNLQEQVIPFIRAREKPLSLYIFSNDSATSDYVINVTSSGGAVVNDTIVHLANPNLPFGGVGSSGMGSYHGKHSFDCFSYQKAVVKRRLVMDNGLRYPPYSSSDMKVVNMAMNPALNHYIDTLTDVVCDRKNLLISFMAFLMLKNRLSSSRL